MSEPITVKAKISGPCRYDCTKVLVSATGRIMNDNVHIRVDNSIAKQFVARVNADTPTYSPQDVEELIEIIALWKSSVVRPETDRHSELCTICDRYGRHHETCIIYKLDAILAKLKGECQHTYQVPLNRDDPDLGPCASCGELPSTKDNQKGGAE